MRDDKRTFADCPTKLRQTQVSPFHLRNGTWSTVLLDGRGPKQRHLPFCPPCSSGQAFGGNLGALLAKMVAIGDILGGGTVWELDDGEGDINGAKLERVGDLSPNGAFGRCLVYRVDVSQLLEVGVVLVSTKYMRHQRHHAYGGKLLTNVYTPFASLFFPLPAPSRSAPSHLAPSRPLLSQNKNERARLFRQLHAFRLCTAPRPREDPLRFPLRVRVHSSGQLLNGYSHLETYHALPWRVKFLVEVGSAVRSCHQLSDGLSTECFVGICNISHALLLVLHRGFMRRYSASRGQRKLSCFDNVKKVTLGCGHSTSMSFFSWTSRVGGVTNRHRWDNVGDRRCDILTHSDLYDGRKR